MTICPMCHKRLFRASAADGDQPAHSQKLADSFCGCRAALRSGFPAVRPIAADLYWELKSPRRKTPFLKGRE